MRCYSHQKETCHVMACQQVPGPFIFMRPHFPAHFNNSRYGQVKEEIWDQLTQIQRTERAVRQLGGGGPEARKYVSPVLVPVGKNASEFLKIHCNKGTTRQRNARDNTLMTQQMEASRNRLEALVKVVSVDTTCRT
jgi:hypothetical protein